MKKKLMKTILIEKLIGRGPTMVRRRMMMV